MNGPRDYHTNEVIQRKITYDITYMLNVKMRYK